MIQEIDNDLMCNKKTFLLSTLLRRYKALLPQNGENYKSTRLRSRLEKHYGTLISFLVQHGQGQSTIVLCSSIKLGDAIKAARRLKQEVKSWQPLELAGDLTDESGEQVSAEQAILYNAASILKADMAKVEHSHYYPTPSEVSLHKSVAFVPKMLQTFILWLINAEAYHSISTESQNESVVRRCLSIAECIVFSSSKIITPLHMGLAVQLHNEFGSLRLIDILHLHGFCISYDNLRRFMTSAAETEIETLQDGVYIPNGIVSCADGGHLIHEGDDNIDINAETIDGKNTFHSMARVIFQERSADSPATTHIAIEHTKSKSLAFCQQTEGLMQCATFGKPKIRAEQCKMVIHKLNSCKTDMKPVLYHAWCLLRLLHQSVLPMPNGVVITPNQIIPFWSGSNHHLCRKRPSYTAVTYAPIIDAKPADMATVYTTMRRCKDMCAALGQRHALQTMDQQLYAIAQQVKWALPDELGGNVLRMGGFHTLSCFIACVGKCWGDAGLLDFLVDSGVYAASTAYQMLAGKQFNRALRGLTLAYETLTAMKLAAFAAWCERSGGSHVVSPVVWGKLADAQQTYKYESKQQTIIQEVCDVITQHLLPKLHEFQRGGYVKSPTFQFWDQLLEALQILLQNVRAEREGNWGLHLQTQRAMVPYFFAADRQHYARWTPVYILDMLNLPREV